MSKIDIVISNTEFKATMCKIGFLWSNWGTAVHDER